MRDVSQIEPDKEVAIAIGVKPVSVSFELDTTDPN